jgi:CubicO group peptidase (beta-lactamase class C family)
MPPGISDMTSGTLEFDGTRYLDGSASDPNALGWMQGAPPPELKRIRFQDDKFLKFPEIRWSLSHVRELLPTVPVWRGGGKASDLGALADALSDRTAPVCTASPIDALTFHDLHGRQLSWAQSLLDTYTDGIVVLHRGRRIFERYFGALQPHGTHACFSITKSYAATVAAALLHEGVLDETRTVPYYIEELRGTAYADATLREVLDMQVAIAYSENYADPEAQFWQYGRAGGLRPSPAGYTGPDHHYAFLKTLRKDGEHGLAFDYKTVNTEVLCWVMARVCGIPLAQLLSERIWSRLGCEEDAYLAVDSIGVATGGAGLNASLRDVARFGELMRCEGSCDGKQVIPAAVVADIRRGADAGKFAKAGYELLPGYSYRNMWWVGPQESGIFEGRGIHGQRLYIVPKAELVIARFASHPIASSAANDPVTLPAFAALTALLS